ncbi:hypothetical protein ACIBG8_07225 [Nonomuraea sp. NPDC050556]|uniref:hypothetical protein n=1 Tax=Nonomuraea sp. NPDC050556 TaxID=3364369 RepID=UPI0037A25CE0
MPIFFRESPALVFADAVGTVTSGMLDQKVRDLLVAVCFSENYGAALTVSDTEGRAWVKQAHSNVGPGTCAVFTTWAEATSTATVTLATDQDDAALKVFIAAGVDPFTPIGAIFVGQSELATFAPTTWVATRRGSIAVGGGTEYSASGVCSSPDYGEAFDASSDMGGVAVQKPSPAESAGEAVTLTFTTTASSPRWAVAAVELLPREGVPYQNSFDGGAHGASVTPANSDGLSGDPFTGCVGNPVYSSDQFHGAAGLSVVNGVLDSDTHIDWTAPQPGNSLYVRFYLFRTGALTSGNLSKLFAIISGAGVDNIISAVWQRNTSGLIRAFTGFNTDTAKTAATTAVPIPLNAWVRVEICYTLDAAQNGTVEIWTYLDPDSLVHDDYVISAPLTWPGSKPETAEFHLIKEAAGALHMDDIALGPAKVGPVAGDGRRRRLITSAAAIRRAGTW